MTDQQEAMEAKIKELNELAKNATSAAEALRLYSQATQLEEFQIRKDR